MIHDSDGDLNNQSINPASLAMSCHFAVSISEN